MFTRDLDGVGPYLDPAKPVSREHIERAAKEAGMPTDKPLPDPDVHRDGSDQDTPPKF